MNKNTRDGNMYCKIDQCAPVSPLCSGYNCVIYGWDPRCTMSQEWITTMRVHQLSNGANQPFYNVLVQDGTCRYAAQENLEPHSAPLEIAHPEVGRYFSEFSDTHYVANEELQARYPEDMTETLGTVGELYRLSPSTLGSEGLLPSVRPNADAKSP